MVISSASVYSTQLNLVLVKSDIIRGKSPGPFKVDRCLQILWSNRDR